MQQKRAWTRGRLFTVVATGFVGYLIGAWNATLPRSAALSAAQTVALRFPQDWADTPVQAAERVAQEPMPASAIDDSALLSPQPMVPIVRLANATVPAAAAQPASPPVRVQLAAVDENAEPSSSLSAAAAQRLAAAAQAKAAAAAAAARRRVAERPGYMLNDAQIASIKERLHLTQDQERMWPAVEAALRNFAYAKAHEIRSRVAAANPQFAAADSNSAQVQDLKSAAIPLLMSFNSEQKDEVRNLAHVMGLDQLASQF